MNVLEAIRNRRSVREYESRPVELEKIQVCLEAARWAPSASNKQPWHFLVIQDPDICSKLGQIHPYGKFLAEAPVNLIVLGDTEVHEKYFLSDSAVACQNFLLAAYAQGLSTCWTGAYKTSFEGEIKTLLGIPPHYHITAVVAVGYSNQKPTKDRKELNELVSYEKYGVTK